MVKNKLPPSIALLYDPVLKRSIKTSTAIMSKMRHFKNPGDRQKQTKKNLFGFRGSSFFFNSAIIKGYSYFQPPFK